MPQSQLQTAVVSDFLEWNRDKRLDLNPHFQRRQVWSPQAKTMLIDTILREFPIPKIYIRTRIEPDTQLAYREVVDGQQRLRAIIEFAAGGFALGRRAQEFQGMRYGDLSAEDQQRFLSYTLAVEHLFNASDDQVLEVFSRLNSYTVPLNAAELRHATYQGEFKWAVHEASKRHAAFWENYGIFTRQRRLRMADDALVAEMYGILLRGIADGGDKAIKLLYEDYDMEFPPKDSLDKMLDKILRHIQTELGEIIIGGSVLARPPHFLMIFAAFAHADYGLGIGGLSEGELPVNRNDALANRQVVIENLQLLGDLISEERETVPNRWRRFHSASRASTHRLSSRRVRFPVYFRALLPEKFPSI